MFREFRVPKIFAVKRKARTQARLLTRLSVKAINEKFMPDSAEYDIIPAVGQEF
jgi:hypothetical protein